MTKEELATERNEVREILEGFSEELSQSNLDKLSRVFCIINGDEKRIIELEAEVNRLKLNEQIAVNNGKNLLKENADLEAQIEKMKCCQNCSHLCSRCELGIDGCYVCSKWELRR